MKSSGTGCFWALFINPDAADVKLAFNEDEDVDCTILADLVRICDAGRSVFCLRDD